MADKANIYKEAFKKALLYDDENSLNNLYNAIEVPFDEFIKSCIIGNDPILVTNHSGSLNKNNIVKLKEKLESQEDGAKKALQEGDDLYIVMMHALWFVIFIINGWDHHKTISNALTNQKDALKDVDKKYLNGSLGISSAPSYYSRERLAKNFVSLWADMKVYVAGKGEPIDSEEIKAEILKRCTNNENKILATLRNQLLFLCRPDMFEPILADSIKKQIVRELQKKDCIDCEEIDKTIPEWEAMEIESDKLTTDKKLYNLRKQLQNKRIADSLLSFFSTNLLKLWKKDNLSVVELLEYKKAIILYGPPGTGKTHDAQLLIEELCQRWNDSNQDAKGTELPSKSYTLDLQMHLNYSYDDFVIGQVFKNGEVVVKSGELLRFIEKMKYDKSGHPYFVVLDEINRVDISRVFGEVFSAMEYRDKEIDLPYGQKLRIPENLYFIGTMNEIDFSLEHIDFALRRRFVWVRKGFNKDTLQTIINEKNESCGNVISREKIELYIENCEKLNVKIRSEFGESYEIGHTFFAEIVPICAKLPQSKDSASFKDAIEILWEISIKPTIEAYCGSMSESARQQFIGKDSKAKGSCREIFFKDNTKN